MAALRIAALVRIRGREVLLRQAQRMAYAVGAAPRAEGDDKDEAKDAKPMGIFDVRRYTAPREYNRWRAIPPLALAQGAMGGVYSWSVFNAPLSKALGVVAPAAGDWGLSEVVPIFSACAVGLGLSTWFLGGWADRVGPRKVIATSGCLWVAGLALSGLGVATHTLPLLYVGYGALGGAGWGLGYLAPVHTMMKWFANRRGLATGLALTTFGGGAMVATPLNEALLRATFVAPTYVGTLADVSPTLVRGAGGARMLPMPDGSLAEVVVATARDLAGTPGLAEGVYLAGTGSSGAAETFAALAAIYALVMTVGAAYARVPHPHWKAPDAPSAKVAAARASGLVESSLSAPQAMRTPQFYLLWTSVFGNAVGAVSVMSCAKTIMMECFGSALPALVTGSFAAGYVASLSAANMVGRLSWASLSDVIGRKTVYGIFGLSVPIALSIPMLTSSVAAQPTLPPLALFYGETMLMAMFYGGLFSVLPAKIADLFGPEHAGALHGRLLTAWSAAAVVGPSMLAHLRDSAYGQAVRELASKAEPARFAETFGAPVSELDSLIAGKGVTISRLMQLMPEGTVDPTPLLYDSTMYFMAGGLGVAFVANALIFPVRK